MVVSPLIALMQAVAALTEAGVTRQAQLLLGCRCFRTERFCGARDLLSSLPSAF